MRNVSLPGAVILVLLSACHSDDTATGGKAAQYDVVAEGAASGVTATINGAGEQTPPVMTNTAADTTTSLATFQSGLPQVGTTPTTTDPYASTLPAPTATYVPPPQTTPRTESRTNVQWSNSRPAAETTTAAPATEQTEATPTTETVAPQPAEPTTTEATETAEPAESTEAPESTPPPTSTSPQ
jgi:hypothetical protein